MKKAMFIVSAVVATAVAGTVMLGGKAANAAAQCEVKGINSNVPFGTAVYIGENDTAFTVSGNTITGKIKVTGSAGCSTPVTLAIWQTPNRNGQPINQQKLYSFTTNTYGLGNHTIRATIPDCYFQADILRSTNPKAPDGTANYGWQNGAFVTDGSFRGYAFGGNKVCVPEEETPGKTVKSTTPAATPTSLPVTGPESVILPVAGLSVAAGVAHNLYNRRRLARR